VLNFTATCQSNFEQGVALTLHTWENLTLAVQNEWGGPDSADKRDWFAGTIVELFPDLTKPQNARSSGLVSEDVQEPDLIDVRERLLQVMEDEFEVVIDDGTDATIAEQIMRLRKSCIKGQFSEVEALQQKWSAKKDKKVIFHRGEDQDAETDWETDDEDDDGDVEMEEAPKLMPTPREKLVPEVDEDGFTKVTRKKR